MVTIQDENNPRIILNLGGSILATTLLSVLLLTAYVTVRSGFAISIAQEQNSNLSSSDSALIAGTNTTTTGINSTQVDFASNI